MKFNLVASCALGLESVVARELNNLGMADVHADNGRVKFTGDESALCRANLWLRSADRVWWSLKKFPCSNFEELFLGVKSIPWPELMPVNAEFPVDAHT